MSREELWNQYWSMVYDSASVPEEDYERLEQEFNDNLDSGDVQKMIYNLENIRHEINVLIDLIQEESENADNI